MRRKTKVAALTTAMVLSVLAVAFALAACGSGSSPASGESAAPKNEQVKTYLQQMGPVYNQISAAAKSAGAAVAGLSAKPDATWTKASAQIKTAAGQLGAAVSTLQGITPPSNVKATQENAVKALQEGQKTLEDISAYLAKRTSDPGYPDIKKQIEDKVSNALAQLFSIMMDEAHSLSGSTPATGQ